MRKMNANDLLTALRGHETVTFEIRNLGSTTHETKEFEEAVSEIEHALSRSRIRNTATEPPTEKDGDECGRVLACVERSGVWSSEYWEFVKRYPEAFTKWTCLPEFEGGEA